MIRKLFFFIPVALLLLSCGNEKEMLEHAKIVRAQSSHNLGLLLNSAQSVQVEVLYEAGAEPYTAKNSKNQPNWSILENNLKHIYELRQKATTLNIPKELSEMKLLPIQNKATWSSDDVINAIEENRDHSSTKSNGVIHILFVKGYFKDQDGVKNGVIGINVTGTTYIAIFKDVVSNMGSRQDDNIAKFSEQSTLVHEVGHAMGLVNSGVSQVNDHHDSEHGAHCSNEDCVMFWKNEGASNLASFIARYLVTGKDVMFGPHCLEDLTKYK